MTRTVRAAYNSYEFHMVYRAIYNFCVIDMSKFYLDIIKDRLYCDGTNSLSRRSAQTALYTILSGMTRLVAPILAFTSDEIWQAMRHAAGDRTENVVLNDMPDYDPALVLSQEELDYWAEVIALRTDVNKALELSRAEKKVGKPLDAKLTLFVGESAKETFARIKDADFKQICIVSEVEIAEGDGAGSQGEQFPGLTVQVEPSTAPKCPRCWMHSDTVGTDPDEPELCARCAAALKA